MSGVAYYHVYADSRGEWRWRYIATNGRTVADSAEGYINRADCLRGIEIMKGSAHSPVV